MNKQELREASGVNLASVAKLGKCENVTTDILLCICKTLTCVVADIMKIVKDEEQQ